MPRPASWLTSPVNWPRPMRGDRRLVVQAVAAHDVDRPFEHEPGRRLALAHLEDDLAWARIRAPAPLAKRLAVSIWAASSTGNIW